MIEESQSVDGFFGAAEFNVAVLSGAHFAFRGEHEDPRRLGRDLELVQQALDPAAQSGFVVFAGHVEEVEDSSRRHDAVFAGLVHVGEPVIAAGNERDEGIVSVLQSHVFVRARNSDSLLFGRANGQPAAEQNHPVQVLDHPLGGLAAVHLDHGRARLRQQELHLEHVAVEAQQVEDAIAGDQPHVQLVDHDDRVNAPFSTVNLLRQMRHGAARGTVSVIILGRNRPFIRGITIGIVIPETGIGSLARGSRLGLGHHRGVVDREVPRVVVVVIHLEFKHPAECELHFEPPGVEVGPVEVVPDPFGLLNASELEHGPNAEAEVPFAEDHHAQNRRDARANVGQDQRSHGLHGVVHLEQEDVIRFITSSGIIGVDELVVVVVVVVVVGGTSRYDGPVVVVVAVIILSPGCRRPCGNGQWRCRVIIHGKLGLFGEVRKALRSLGKKIRCGVLREKLGHKFLTTCFRNKLLTTFEI